MLISYSKKETKNLGNYESVSVEIKIEDEVNSETETPQECLIRLKAFVSTNINQELGMPSHNNNNIKQQILELINFDPNNKIIIKNMLAEFGATKVGDLAEKSLIDLSNRLHKLRKNYA